jgi:ABC-2 type transport system ATP-binding protein
LVLNAANGRAARRRGVAPDAASRHIWRMLAPAATPADAPVVVERLVKAYKAVIAVDGISFVLAAGSCTALLGGNGAGKTTTISTIMGLVEPTSGSVTVLGAEMPRQRHRVLHRMNFESPYVNMPMRLTVRQNLNVFGMLYGCRDVAGRIGKLADELDLHEFLDRQTGKLSSGQKTRVALAKSLINEPDILLLDEPTASLDPDTADWGARPLGALPPRLWRHGLAGFAQHG